MKLDGMRRQFTGWQAASFAALLGFLAMTAADSCPTDADGDGYTVEAGDCDDTNAAVYPGAPEFCDGLDNDCDGVVDETCFCLTDADCATGSYCFFEEGCDGGETGTFGTCEEMPPLDTCPRLWDPVCGCDGNTYANDCEAASAGVNVDYPGECEPQYCWGNDMCDKDEYCYFADCALETGVCEERPTDCPDVWDPVCGCDGNTYGNACEAAMAGMSVDHDGECGPKYCWGNDMCDKDEYCYFADCALETGVCEDRPDACPDVWDPVCGCDANTYGNACIAASSGMSVDYDGECKQ